MGIPVIDFPLPVWVAVLAGCIVAVGLLRALVGIWRHRDGAALIGLTGLLLTLCSSSLWLYGRGQGQLLVIAGAGCLVGFFALAFWARVASQLGVEGASD